MVTKTAKAAKASAREVWDLADRIIRMQGSTFDCDVDEIRYTEEGWTIGPGERP
jgi:hypothetical protein